MKVLFSPSETKTSLAYAPCVHENSFIFPHLYPKRMEVLHRYDALLHSASSLTLQKLFGIKEIGHLKDSPLERLTCKAIERYDGVAYDYLSYGTLDEKAQRWIAEHVMIFSNLFGPILAHDFIPEYKLHQGETLEGFKPEAFYKEHFSDAITSWIDDEAVLDLRAGFYEKFYTLNQPYLTMKFLKQGKVVSHFAKAYRGRILRQIACVAPNNVSDFANIAFEGLRIVEIKQSRFKHEYVYDIID